MTHAKKKKKFSQKQKLIPIVTSLFFVHTFGCVRVCVCVWVCVHFLTAITAASTAVLVVLIIVVVTVVVRLNGHISNSNCNDINNSNVTLSRQKSSESIESLLHIQT